MAELFQKIHHVETCDSTNQVLKELVPRGAKAGTVVVSAVQTSGRGRGNHVWASPKGGVYFSALLPARDPKRLSDLSIVAGVAVAQAVRDCLPKAVEVGLKWPNDCLLNGKKVGGILCEAIPEDRHGMCVVGIGINVNIGAELLQPYVSNPFSATSFLMECPGGDFKVERVVQIVLKKLENVYLSYLQHGFQGVQYLWERNCAFIGKKVQVTVSEKPEATSKVEGVFLGLDELGAMVLAIGSQGERRRFVSGEVTCFWP
jgi:BirA family transcriptional regulator, biotin operon repressor / biotin---[acetyl-CoA-carboxylase] ligase